MPSVAVDMAGVVGETEVGGGSGGTCCLLSEAEELLFFLFTSEGQVGVSGHVGFRDCRRLSSTVPRSKGTTTKSLFRLADMDMGGPIRAFAGRALTGSVVDGAAVSTSAGAACASCGGCRLTIPGFFSSRDNSHLKSFGGLGKSGRS